LIDADRTGGKSASKATYIPNSYAKAQNNWIDSFYASNGYLEVGKTLVMLQMKN
jgi:E3 UFM1-protein ligase 1